MDDMWLTLPRRRIGIDGAVVSKSDTVPGAIAVVDGVQTGEVVIRITEYGGDILEPMQHIAGSEDVEEVLDITFTVLHLLKGVFSEFEGWPIRERSPVMRVGARRWRRARRQ